MSGNSTTDVVKRLSYGQLSAQRQTEFSEAQAVSHALSNPSLEALKGALESVSQANTSRFSNMIHVAQKQAPHGDESDLKRLAKQLSMAKGNFQAYDVQSQFMSELMAGKPDGTENQATEEAQARAQTLSDELKMQKESNAKLREGILEAINELVSIHDNMGDLEAKAAAGLQGVEATAAEDIPLDAKNLMDTEQKNPEAQQLAKFCAEQEQVIAELEAALAEEQRQLAAEMEALHERDSAASARDSADRFQSTEEWYRELELLTSTLTGVRLDEIRQDCIHVTLKTVLPQNEGDPSVLEHKLGLQLLPRTSQIQSLSLTPNDVYMEDIHHQVIGKTGMLGKVVQETHSRIYAQHLRRAQFKDVPEEFSMRLVSNDGAVVRGQVAAGWAEAELRLPLLWPLPGIELEVTDLQAASGADLSAVLCELQSANLGKWTLADVMKHTDARVKEVTG